MFQVAPFVSTVLGLIVPNLIEKNLNRGLNFSGIIGSVLFVLFMQRLARFVGRDDLAAKAKNVLIFSSVMMVVSVAMAAAVLAKILVGDIVVGLLGIVLIICVLIVFVMYANLVNYLRNALGSQN